MAFRWLAEIFSDAPSAWSAEQRQRLQYERKTLARYFPGFAWHDPVTPGKTYVAGVMQTNAGRRYTIRLNVPTDVPNSPPAALVVRPKPLYDYWNRSLATGVSSSMHILSPENGCVSICHYRPGNWTPRLTFYLVLVKVRLWLEAYEGHRATGKPIDHFLKHQ